MILKTVKLSINDWNFVTDWMADSAEEVAHSVFEEERERKICNE